MPLYLVGVVEIRIRRFEKFFKSPFNGIDNAEHRLYNEGTIKNLKGGARL